MENQDENYTTNEEKFQSIIEKFPEISTVSIYSTQLKIAAKEYVGFLNKMSEHTKEVSNVNSGVKKGGTIAIKRGDHFVVNEKFVQKCIKEAREKDAFLLFSFSKVNIVLDKLEDVLAKR